MGFAGVARGIGQAGNELGEATFGLQKMRLDEDAKRAKMISDGIRLRQIQQRAGLTPKPDGPAYTVNGKQYQKMIGLDGLPFVVEVPGVAPKSKQEDDVGALMALGMTKEQAMKQVAPNAFKETGAIRTVQAGLAQSVQAAMKRGVKPGDDPDVQSWMKMLPVPKTTLEQKYFDAVKAGDTRTIDQLQEVIWQTRTTPRAEAGKEIQEAKPVQVTDVNTGANIYVPAKKAEEGAMPAASSQLDKTAYMPKARLDDMVRAVKNVDSNLDAFSQADLVERGRFASILRAAEASESPGFVHSLVQSELMSNLTGEKSKVAAAGILSLREQIMAAMQMLAAGGSGSDARVGAIWNTIPKSGDDEQMARIKMSLVHGMLQNLVEGYPKLAVIPGGKETIENIKALAVGPSTSPLVQKAAPKNRRPPPIPPPGTEDW